jgi:hypothetical protein
MALSIDREFHSHRKIIIEVLRIMSEYESIPLPDLWKQSSLSLVSIYKAVDILVRYDALHIELHRNTKWISKSKMFDSCLRDNGLSRKGEKQNGNDQEKRERICK